MSETENNLTIDILRGLLSESPHRGVDTDAAGCVKYDFRRARYFNAGQVSKLRDFAGRAAQIIATRFTNFFSGNFEVSSTKIEQQYLADYLKAEAEKSGLLYLCFSAGGQETGGFIKVPQDAAMSWLKDVLGESESQQAAELSQLEKSFLFDIVSMFVDSLLVADKKPGFKSKVGIWSQRPELKIGPADVLCVFGFDVKKSGAEKGCHINVIIIAAALDSTAERKTQAESKLSAGDLSDIISYHIGDCLVPLTVQFDPTMLTLEEVVGIQEGDVVILDKTVGDNAGIYLDSQRLFEGSLARVGTKKGILICRPAKRTN